MDRVRVALCIPTYERSEWIADFLENYAPHYIEAGIDIYYYDGSESTKTKEVVCGYPQKEHVFYIKRPSDFSVITIFQGCGLHKEYDFIWLCNDAVQLRKDAIDILMANLSTDYDIVEVNGSGRGPGTRIFRNCNEYMQQCAWHTTLFGALLLNTHTMLNVADWSNHTAFFSSGRSAYAHVEFYFNRILELDQFCALHLAMDPQIVRGSKYKKRPGWMRQYFKIHLEDWVGTIERLPDYYTGKNDAIKKIEYFQLAGWRTMCYRRIDRDYTIKEYLKYRNVWGKATTVPRYKLFILALTPSICVKKILEYHLGRSRELRQFRKFYHSFSQIVLFGLGDSAFKYARYFEQQGMELKGFCAQRAHGKKEYMGYPIFTIDDVSQMENTGVIVALGEEGASVAIPDIVKKVDADHVYFSKGLEPVIWYETGYYR